MKEETIKAIFTDIGGVLLTNGWDRKLRQEAAKAFSIDADEMDERHHLAFDTYEQGKMTLDEYLSTTVFYQPRNFTMDTFIKFIFSKSQAHKEMIDWVKEMKKKYHLKVVAISNEGREILEYRIKTFKLTEFIDFFVCSSFVHLRKPDPEIFKMALDFSQIEPQNSVYIDDRLPLVEMAEMQGMQGIHHTTLENTQKKFNTLVS